MSRRDVYRAMRNPITPSVIELRDWCVEFARPTQPVPGLAEWLAYFDRFESRSPR